MWEDLLKTNKGNQFPRKIKGWAFKGARESHWRKAEVQLWWDCEGENFARNCWESIRKEIGERDRMVKCILSEHHGEQNAEEQNR